MIGAPKAEKVVVLTVDDDDAVRSSVCGFLEDCDFTVLEAADGATGLQIFEREHPDLLLLDLRMRAPDGFDVLAKARKQRPDIPVVVLSSTSDVHDAVRALRLGAWDFVLKPVVDLNLLEHAVNRALERSRMLKERDEYQKRLECEVTDRTVELRQANAELRLAAFAFDTQEAIFITDKQSRILRVNAAFTRLTGYEPDDVIGKTPRMLRSDRQDKRFYANLWSKLLENGMWQGEIWNRRKDGSVVPQWLSITAVAADDGEVTHYVATALDLTELKRQQATITRKAEEERVLGLLANLSIEPTSLDQYLAAALSTLLKSASWLGLLARGGILLCEEEGTATRLKPRTGDGLSRLQLAQCAHVPADWQSSACGAARVRTAYVASCDTMVLDSSHPRQVPHGHYMVPIVAGNRLLGMMLLYVPATHVPSHHEIRFLNGVGEALSLGILRKRAEQRASHLAFYDALTGLPNRRLFLDRLEQAINSAKRQNYSGALLFIDLDHFKTLNDGLGHASGDLLLRKVARRIRSALRDGDTVARLGGDEFVVLLPLLLNGNDKPAGHALQVAEKLREAVRQPIDLKVQQHTVTCSIGIVLFPNDSNDVQELLRFADMAMYSAKREGRDTVRLFQVGMQAAAHARLTLNKELRTALASEEIVLHYQPQWDVNRKLVGAEALVRWRHPQHGLVAPDAFVSLAEESGLIVSLGERVLRESFRQLKRWEQTGQGKELRWLYINVSALQFRQPDFVDLVCDLVKETGVNPGRIGLEITESTVVHDIVDTKSKVEALKAKGMRLSVDDFGTGYSSLVYLKSLPLDALKIDRSFVRDIVSDPNGAAIVQTIIAMAANLSLEVIAEGVETVEQLNFLHHHGCRIYQGYLVARPLPQDEFIRMWEQGIGAPLESASR